LKRGDTVVQRTEEIIEILINNICAIDEVQSIGLSGSKSPLPKSGEGDIDIFIYCETIPDPKKRQGEMDLMGDMLKESKINAFEGGHWGTGDFAIVNGVETWLMYFTVNEALDEVQSILDGKHPDKLDNYYYPVGRCAMLKNINVLYDKNGFLYSLKQRLLHYPEELSRTLVEYHLDELEDTEDLQRAVDRGDVLFYHFALDIAIDHFLQALFALNRIYFPSRKRTLSFIEKFNIKPEKCDEKLLQVIRLGSASEGINDSYCMFKDMVNQLKRLFQKAQEAAKEQQDMELGDVYVCPVCGYNESGEVHDQCQRNKGCF